MLVISMCKASGVAGEDEGPPAPSQPSLPAAQAFDQALVKEERVARSGGPLDSDLLISRLPALLPALLPPAATRLQLALG